MSFIFLNFDSLFCRKRLDEVMEERGMKERPKRAIIKTPKAKANEEAAISLAAIKSR